MITNLESTFNSRNSSYQLTHNYLEQFISSLHVQILGQGIRQEHFLEKVDDFLLPSFLLVYYEQGSVTLRHNKYTTVLEPGSLYIFTPFELYDARRNGSVPLIYKYIYFDVMPISSRSIFKKYAFSGDDKYFQEEWYHTIGATLFKDAYNDAETQIPGYNFLLQYAVRGIIAYIMFSRTPSDATGRMLAPNKSTALIDQAFSYTEQHLNEPINISKIVRHIGTSRSTIDRVFLDIMQITPVKALTRYKAREALIILQSGKSVKEASIELGYSSIFHFSNTFKSIFGKSPRSYLKY